MKLDGWRWAFLLLKVFLFCGGEPIDSLLEVDACFSSCTQHFIACADEQKENMSKQIIYLSRIFCFSNFSTKDIRIWLFLFLNFANILYILVKANTFKP